MTSNCVVVAAVRRSRGFKIWFVAHVCSTGDYSRRTVLILEYKTFATDVCRYNFLIYKTIERFLRNICHFYLSCVHVQVITTYLERAISV